MQPETIVAIVSSITALLVVVVPLLIKRVESSDAAKAARAEAARQEQDANLKEATEWREKYFEEKNVRLLAEIEAKQLKAELESLENRYQKGA